MSDRRAGKRGLPKDDRAYEDDDAADGEVVAGGGVDVAKRTRISGSTNNEDATTSTNNNNNTIDLFANGLVTTMVCSFLDVKELLHLAMCSKFIGEQIKHEHVVVSALMHGGHAKSSMERLVGLIRGNTNQQQHQRKIYVPSPLRMLRLMNGKRCERCNEAKVNMVSQDFGVFLCWGRCNSLFTKRVARNNKWSPFLEHPRVAAAKYSSNCYIFACDYRDTAREACGPLVTLHTMQAVMRGQTTTEEFLKQRDEADVNTKYADEIAMVFDRSQKAVENRLREKLEKKKDATKIAVETKREKIHAIVEKLKGLLGEVPWKEALLDYEAVTVPSSSSKYSVVRFSNRIVERLLIDIVKTPSKATKTKLQELSEAILEKFTVVGEKQYHDFSFLSNSDPLESALLEYYSETFPNSEHLGLLLESHLDLLREGNCLESLESMDKSSFRDRLLTFRSTCSFQLEKHRHLQSFLSFDQIIARKIASSLAYAGDGDVDRKKKGEGLAVTYWKKECRSNEDKHACFQSCTERFPALHQQVVDFLSSPEMAAWKETSYYSAVWPNPEKQIWAPNYPMFDLLSERDYKGLVKALSEIGKNSVRRNF